MHPPVRYVSISLSGRNQTPYLPMSLTMVGRQMATAIVWMARRKTKPSIMAGIVWRCCRRHPSQCLGRRTVTPSQDSIRIHGPRASILQVLIDFTVGAVDREGEIGNFFTGRIGGLAMYNRALSPAEPTPWQGQVVSNEKRTATVLPGQDKGSSVMGCSRDL